MPDRIDDPWGARTPFGREQDWPERVDSHLAEGVAEGEVDRWVQTASLLHSNGDAMDIAVKDGREHDDLAAVGEAALLIVAADDPESALASGLAAFDTLLERLAGSA